MGKDSDKIEHTNKTLELKVSIEVGPIEKDGWRDLDLVIPAAWDVLTHFAQSDLLGGSYASFNKDGDLVISWSACATKRREDA